MSSCKSLQEIHRIFTIVLRALDQFNLHFCQRSSVIAGMLMGDLNVFCKSSEGPWDGGAEFIPGPESCIPQHRPEECAPRWCRGQFGAWMVLREAWKTLYLTLHLQGGFVTNLYCPCALPLMIYSGKRKGGEGRGPTA